MDKKNKSQDDNATVIKPSLKSNKSETPSTTKRSSDYEAALTRISNSFHSTNNSQGFEKAKSDANKALTDNKIILNNRFVLESTLGVGGMGTVYKARDLRKVEARDLNPYIAVKVLNSDFRDHPDAFVTLQRETSRSHILSHPNIVTVHDFDRDGNVVYMTMELLEGQGLDALLDSKKGIGFAPEKAYKIIDGYCTALIHAHKKNIIHSDLKPGNIFITKSGVKVLDFGIARISADAQQVDDFDAGTLGAITPAYACLEMINNESPDQSDDIYAAAIIAYELLTGEHPFDRKPANQALEEDLQPKRIKHLSNRRWKALRSGLHFKRKDRTKKIETFLVGLTRKRNIPIFKVASIALATSVGWFTYNTFYAPNEISEIINETMVKANNCYSEKNYSCTIKNTKIILELEQGNQAANDLLEKSQTAFTATEIDRVMTVSNRCLGTNDIVCAENGLKELIKIESGSRAVAILRNSIKSKQQENTLSLMLQSSRTCFNNKDYGCVISKTESINNITPINELTSSLSNKILLLRNKSNKNLNINNKKFSDYMAKGTQCLKVKNYNCAQSQANLALKIKPDNSKAANLKQEVFFAKTQHKIRIKKVRKILIKAEKCYKIKNYSCAIAKTESALEVIPNYTEALALKNKATSEIKKLKQSIMIE